MRGFVALVAALGSLLLVLVVHPVQAEKPALPTAAAPSTVAIVTRTAVGPNPRGVAADEATERVYVGLFGAADDRNLAVVDAMTGSLIATMGTLGSNPNAVAVDSSRGLVYVTNRNSNDLSVVNPASSDRHKVGVGMHPWGLAVHPALNRIYVASYDSASLSIIDGATRSVIKTVGGIPQAAHVAVDPAADRVYVTSVGMGTWVLNSNGDVVRTMNTGADSRGVAVNPTNGRVYIVNHDPANPRLFVSQAGADPSVYVLPAPPVNVAVNPTTNHVFVTLLAAGRLSVAVLDGDTNDVMTTIDIGPEDGNEGGQGIAVDSARNRVFVTRFQAGELVILADEPPATPTLTATATPSMTSTGTATPTASATATPALPSPTLTATPTPTLSPNPTQTLPSPTATATATATKPVPTATATFSPTPLPTGTVGVVFTTTVGIRPKGLAANTVRHHLYVTMILENIVKVYDGQTGASIKNLATGGSQPNGVAVNEQTGTVFVTNRLAGNVSAINPDTGAYQTGPSGVFPWGVAVDAPHQRVYVANFGTDYDGYTVGVFDAVSLQTIATTGVGRHPALVAVNPVLGRAYVTTYSSDAGTYVLDGAGNVVDFLLTGSGSFDVATNPATGKVYVTNRLDQKLHIISPGGAHTTTPLGAPGYGVAVNPSTNHLFIITISSGQATLQVRDGNDGALLTTLPLGNEDADDGGQGIAVDAGLGRVYVLNYASGVLMAIADFGVGPTPTATATPTNSLRYRVLLPVIVGYQDESWPTVTPTTTPTVTATFVASPTATPTATATASPVDWQIPDFLHVSIVPASVSSGQAYWRLVRAIYQDETQSGGNHNVYYRLEDENGQSLLGLYVCLGFPWSPYQDCSHLTEARGGVYPTGYTADYPIWGTGWNPISGPGPYSAWAAGLPSDRVVGMGMPLNYHVNFLLTFRRTIAP